MYYYSIEILIPVSPEYWPFCVKFDVVIYSYFTTKCVNAVYYSDTLTCDWAKRKNRLTGRVVYNIFPFNIKFKRYMKSIWNSNKLGSFFCALYLTGLVTLMWIVRTVSSLLKKSQQSHKSGVIFEKQYLIQVRDFYMHCRQ